MRAVRPHIPDAVGHDRRGELRCSPSSPYHVLLQQLPESSTLPSPRCGLCERQRKSEMLLVRDGVYLCTLVEYSTHTDAPGGLLQDEQFPRRRQGAAATVHVQNQLQASGVGGLAAFACCFAATRPAVHATACVSSGNWETGHPRPPAPYIAPRLLFS